MSVSCDDRADVWNERAVRARKAHQCDACKLTIRRGDVYTRDSLLYDGEWSTVIRCARCQIIFEHLQPMCQRDGDCADRELDCGHEYEERWDRKPPEWLAALAFWVPGDPLPAITPCTLFSQWSSPPRWFAEGCWRGVPDWSWAPGIGRYGSCAVTERKYEMRTGRTLNVPVKGDPSCTAVCS